MHLGEASLSEQLDEEVPVVQHHVVVEARLVLVVDPLQFADVQVPLSLQFLHFESEVGVLLLQGGLPELLEQGERRVSAGKVM